MFSNENEVAKDEMKALKWFLKSVEQKNINEQCNLG
jgi:TPR repeat protein